MGCIVALVMIVSCGEGFNPVRVVTNPIDVDYAFTREHQEGGREAADPVVVLFKDRYYLVPSKSYGYWSSEDMQHWTFHTNDLMPFHFYAPTAMVYRGELYWAVSFHNKVYKTSTLA